MQSITHIHVVPSVCFDNFDRIPDSLVLIILNKLADVCSLGRCAVVCKRFNSLIPLVHNVSIKIDRIVSVDGNNKDPEPCAHKPQNLLFNFLKLMLFSMFKPFHHLRQVSNSNKPLLPQLSHYSADQVLKNFKQIHHLRIELPAGDVSTEDGVLIKWKAEFGSTLQSCVILGGTMIDQKQVSDQEMLEDNRSMSESFYTNGSLKLRVVWTISSLIAASTRHFLLQPIINDHCTLKSVILTDVDGQGTLCMGNEQLRDFREKPISTSASSNRTQVPASYMKLRYASYLDLPEGNGMQGATLVVIRPSGEGSGRSRKDVEAFVSGAFDGPFEAAVKALMKQRTYLLEMNGF